MLRKSCLACVFLLTAGGAAGVADELERAPMNRCGPFALQACAVLVGRDTTSREIDSLGIPTDDEGCSLLDLERAARALRLHALGVRWMGDPPRERAPPAIIPIVGCTGDRHFVVIVARQEERVLLIDVPHRPAWVRLDVLRSEWSWQGDALYIAAAESDLDGVRAAMSPHGVTPTVGVSGVLAMLLTAAAILRALSIRRSAPQSQPHLPRGARNVVDHA